MTQRAFIIDARVALAELNDFVAATPGANIESVTPCPTGADREPAWVAVVAFEPADVVALEMRLSEEDIARIVKSCEPSSMVADPVRAQRWAMASAKSVAKYVQIAYDKARSRTA